MADKESIFKWSAPSQLTENYAHIHLGRLSAGLRLRPARAIIDLSLTKWADPLCLMQIQLMMAYAVSDGVAVNLDLGRLKQSSKRDAFLAFLSTQEFTAAFRRFATIDARLDVRSVADDLDAEIAALKALPLLGSHKCIPVQILDMSDYQSQPKKLQSLIEKLISKADELSLKSAFGSSASARDMLFQKLRKTLFELLLNIAEHAYGAGPRYGAVFARLRLAKPSSADEAKVWSNALKKTQSIHGNTKLTPNHFAEWIELFVCDVGRGLTSDIENWKAGDDKSIAAAIRQAARSTNPLESIATRIFRDPLSRHIRHSSSRTSVTGLQHLGRILSIGGDYARIYSQEGTWIGNSFPWDERPTYSRKTLLNPENKEGQLQKGPPGTAFHISIQPQHNSSINHSHPEEIPTQDVLSEIRSAMRAKVGSQLSTQDRSVIAIDRRIAKSGYMSDVESVLSQNEGIIVLRPPRLMSKNDLGSWLKVAVGNRGQQAESTVTGLIIVELSYFHFLTLADLLVGLDTHVTATAGVWLVSDSWSVLSLRSSKGKLVYQEYEQANQNQRLGGLSLCDIAVILRKMDSELFWFGRESSSKDLFIRPALMNVRVRWREAPEKHLEMRRYLDFPQSLADPVAFRACRRALRRLLALYPNSEIRAADELAESILASMSLPGLQPAPVQTATIRDLLVVGSVAVTGDTATVATSKGGTELVNVLHHEDAASEVLANATSALLWLTDVAELQGLEIPSLAEDAPLWFRIPGTSFISPTGPHSLSILRYERSPDGSIDFANHYYARSPEETYGDFRRYKAVRVGHWKYGPRHDLLTINMRAVVAHAFLELGPLYDWLKETFTNLFGIGDSGKTLAHVLVYPSHPVTDYLVDRIRQDDGFKDCLPILGLIPIKFAGERTVSPLVAFQPLRDSINRRISDSGLKEWSSVVLDDGVISGKHMREICQLLEAMHTSAVRTIAIVDRSGLPSQEELMKDHLDKHSRYWRWDVPTLGSHRNCILCHSLALVRLQAASASPRICKRIAEWGKIWEARDSEREWYLSDGRRIRFEPPLAVTFGVDDLQPGEDGRKDLSVEDSVELIALTTEIARLTGNFGTALKRAVKLEALSIDVALELVCAQYLLFVDELTEPEKCRRLEFLASRLWRTTRTSHATALAGLTLASSDSTTAGVLIKSVVDGLILEVEIGSIDAVIAVQGLIRASANSNWLQGVRAPDNQVLQRNLLRLGLQNDAIGAIRSFISVARSEAGRGEAWLHSSRLRETLGRIKDQRRDSLPTGLLPEVLGLLNDTEAALTRIADEQLAQVSHDELVSLRSNILRIRDTLKTNDMQGACLVADAVYVSLFGEGTSTRGLLTTTAGLLFASITKGHDVYSKLVEPLLNRIRRDWPRYVLDRIAVPISKMPRDSRWLKVGGRGVTLPVWREIEPAAQLNCLVYFDNFVQEALRDVMLNVFHSSRGAELSLIRPSHRFDRTADQWWRAVLMESVMLLEFINVAAGKPGRLKDSAAIAGFERVGGSVAVEYQQSGDSEFLVWTQVSIPLLTSFIRRAS